MPETKGGAVEQTHEEKWYLKGRSWGVAARKEADTRWMVVQEPAPSKKFTQGALQEIAALAAFLHLGMHKYHHREVLLRVTTQRPLWLRSGAPMSMSTYRLQ